MKTRGCWIFTADDQVDRRILAHVPPLRSLGLSPVIFAADWAGEENADLPILRPQDPPATGRQARWWRTSRIWWRSARCSLSGITLPANPALLPGQFPGFLQEVYDYRAIFERSQSAWQTGEVSRPRLIVAIDLPVLPAALWWAAKFRIPILVDCHECWAEQATIFFPKQPAQAQAAEYWEKVLYPCCDIRITVGERLAKMMQQRYQCPFHVVYSSCDPLEEPPAPGNRFWTENAGLPAESRVAVFQGHLTPYRNLQTLVRACTQLADNQFVVVLGHGPLADPLRNLAAETGVTDRFRMLGHIPQQDLLRWTAHAHLGLLPHVSVNPYFSCSAPNKLFEYIAAGIPMLYDPGMTEVGDIVGANGFGCAVRCQIPETLGRGISELLADENRLQLYRDNLSRLSGRYLAGRQAETLVSAIRMIHHV